MKCLPARWSLFADSLSALFNDFGEPGADSEERDEVDGDVGNGEDEFIETGNIDGGGGACFDFRYFGDWKKRKKEKCI